MTHPSHDTGRFRSNGAAGHRRWRQAPQNDALCLLIASHLGAGGHSNTAWVDRDLDARADGADAALCVSCDRGFEAV